MVAGSHFTFSLVLETTVNFKSKILQAGESLMLP